MHVKIDNFSISFPTWWASFINKNLFHFINTSPGIAWNWPYSEETLFSRIQSECGKMRTRKTPNMDTFYTVLTIEVHSWCHQYFCGTFSKSRLCTVNASYVNHIIEVTVSLTLVFNQGESLFQVSISYYLWKFNFRKRAYPCYSLSTPYLFVVACKAKQH